MKAPLTIEGFEGHRLEVVAPSFLQGPILTIDGQRVPRGKGRNQYVLQRNDGGPVSIRLKPSLVYDFPSVEINGSRKNLVAPLMWYEYLVSLLPLSLIFGGLLGIALALGIFLINIRILRSQIPRAAEYLFVVTLSLGLPTLYYVVSFLIVAISRGT